MAVELLGAEQEMLTTAELARALKVSSRTLDNWRSASRGPAYFRVEGAVRYRVRDVEEWLEACFVQTLETPGLTIHDVSMSVGRAGLLPKGLPRE